MTIRQRILMYRAFFCHECFALFWFDPVFATCTSPIMHLICPPKFCITFVFHFSWVLQPSREKLKTTLTQNFGRHIRPALWEMCKWRIHDICQLCTRFDGIKAMPRGLLGVKQVLKFANTRNRSRVYLDLFYQTIRKFSLQSAQFEFWQVSRHYHLLWGYLLWPPHSKKLKRWLPPLICYYPV